jgi:hypothetical protein
MKTDYVKVFSETFSYANKDLEFWKFFVESLSEDDLDDLLFDSEYIDFAIESVESKFKNEN